jgi:hypothetical protein
MIAPAPNHEDALRESTLASDDPADEELWTQPQFGLGSLLVLMIPFAIVFTCMARFGAEAVFPVIIILLVIWTLVGCGHIVGLNRKTPLDENDES